MNPSKSKILTSEFVDLAKTFPQWNSPLLSADYIYIQTFKELRLVKDKLSQKKNEAGFFNSEIKLKWLNLKKRQLEFLSDVENYNNFFIENENKCERICEKIKSELKFQEDCERKIKAMEEKRKYLSHINQKLRDSVHRLQPYNEFLKNITGTTKEFKNVKDLINKFVSYNSETNLHDKFRQNLFQTEIMHTQLLHDIKDESITASIQANQLFQFKSQYHQIKDDLEEWTRKLNHQKELSFHGKQEMIIIKHSCDNTYQQLCKWRKIAPMLHLSYAQKMSFIGKMINELQQIVKKAKQLNNKTNLSCEADTSFLTVKRTI